MVFFYMSEFSELLNFIKSDQNTCFTILFKWHILHPDVHPGDIGPYLYFFSPSLCRWQSGKMPVRSLVFPECLKWPSHLRCTTSPIDCQHSSDRMQNDTALMSVQRNSFSILFCNISFIYWPKYYDFSVVTIKWPNHTIWCLYIMFFRKLFKKIFKKKVWFKKNNLLPLHVWYPCLWKRGLCWC